MEFNKPVSNPMLLGCIELMRDEDSQEHREMFAAEFMKSSFLAPAVVDPAPIVNEEGEEVIAPGSKIQFPMLGTQDGKRLFVAFNDKNEYDDWCEKNGKLPCFTLRMEDYGQMLLRKDPMGNLAPAIGLVINPLSTNLLVSREMLANLMARKMMSNPNVRAMMQAHAAEQKAAEEAAKAEGEGSEE